MSFARGICIVAVGGVALAGSWSAPAAAQAAASAGRDSGRAGGAATEPFAFADFTWLNGTTRQIQPALSMPWFTGEFRLDATYIYDAARPRDHTLVGSSESGRAMELQVQQLGVGGDFHLDHVRGRVMTQLGMYAVMTPRNDPSPARGQWSVDNAYRFLSEAYGGYHWDAMHGVNVDAGIFMSYVGLFSYYNFDNWAYQPSYVSSNTPWFFNGLRIQTFPTERLKLEYWIVNGWQSYAMPNETPGLGMQVLWRPTGALSLLSNSYWGRDTPGNARRQRVHLDNSLQVRYREDSSRFWNRGAVSITIDAGCEEGGGVHCGGSDVVAPAQYFLGAMAYWRQWFARGRYAITAGGGAVANPGRYLVLVPPINGATAASGTPYFGTAPGDPFHGWDASLTLDYMPDERTTFRVEFNRRGADVPYFAGPGGVTPPGGNTGAPSSAVSGWTPDLRSQEARLLVALLVKV